MLKSFNKNCLSLLGATLISSLGAYGAVDRERAQVIAPYHTSRGVIVEISRIHSPHTEMPGIRLELNTGSKRRQLAHLSAEWALLNQNLNLAQGDYIAISGPLIKSGNKALLLAKSIRKGRKEIVLVPKEKGL